ncbi:MAG: SDR family NAD(P)-dependent oxidoreductase [Planctomycetales bacterium]|nr:SDR family NAD(P)-dependent oxidoreductase [Planctomycetales bacterium]
MPNLPATSRVLVTGANGFIGQHLCSQLASRGHSVTGLVRSEQAAQQLSQLSVRPARGDVTDAAALTQAVSGHDLVIHLAGVTQPLHSRAFYNVNAEGTRNVILACIQCESPPALIVVSSLAAAGPARSGQPLTELTTARPVSEYGRSKLAAERLARRHAGRLPVSIVRPPIVVGDGDRATLTFFRAIHRFGIHVAPQLVPRHFSIIHVSDLVDLIVRVAADGERCKVAGNDDATTRGQGVYFAECGERPRFGQLGRMIGRALGRRRTLVVPVARPILWSVAVAAEISARVRQRPARLSWDKAREASSGPWICSAEKAMTQLGFCPPHTLQERLEQTAAWYRAHGWL